MTDPNPGTEPVQGLCCQTHTTSDFAFREGIFGRNGLPKQFRTIAPALDKQLSLRSRRHPLQGHIVHCWHSSTAVFFDTIDTFQQPLHQ